MSNTSLHLGLVRDEQHWVALKVSRAVYIRSLLSFGRNTILIKLLAKHAVRPCITAPKLVISVKYNTTYYRVCNTGNMWWLLIDAKIICSVVFLAFSFAFMNITHTHTPVSYTHLTLPTTAEV